MKIYLVGGAVRDKLLNLPVKERDYVVVGATENEMLRLGYRQVGKDFPVFLHPETHEEYALARTERKTDKGYKGFKVDTSPDVSLEEDLIRRDLTINAMAETSAGELIDPYGGLQDLTDKKLRHVSDAFAEDPVRILRSARFLARYAHLGFSMAPETVLLMRKMVDQGEVNALVAERVWKELDRALIEHNPEQFFATLAACHALSILFPYLTADGPGIQALAYAQASLFLLPISSRELKIVRFAVMCHAFPETAVETITSKESIFRLCTRYRVPHIYRELALLTARYHQQAFQAKTASAATLLDLFYALDIFRREQRFMLFLCASQAIAAFQHVPFDAKWLMACAKVAKAYDVSELLDQGLDNMTLAHTIKKMRKEMIEHWLATP